jgi:hypothetical protein
MEYSGARGTLIHEKKLKSKISCQTPFYENKKMKYKNQGVQRDVVYLDWPIAPILHNSKSEPKIIILVYL